MMTRHLRDVGGVSPGGSSYENLMSELVKSFNPNRREVQSPRVKTRNKRCYTTQVATWGHKPHSQVSKTFLDL